MMLFSHRLHFRPILTAAAALVVAALFVTRFVVFQTPVSATNDEAQPTTEFAPAEGEQGLDLSEKQLGLIKVGPVASREFGIVKTAIGTIDFNENMLVQVFSQYPGKILKAFFNVGDDIKRGDVLFTIDSPDLLQAESTLLASAGVLELQKKTLARVTGLLRSGGSAQRDVDQSTSDEQTAEGNFKAARDAVRIFGKSDAEVDQILDSRKIDSTLVISSPIAGRVVARNAAPGLLTQPGATRPPFQVADISTMWMIANVIEADAPAYKVGQPVEATVLAYPDRTFKGRVTNVGSVIDPNTHRQLVRAEIEDPEHLLRSGMFASFLIRVADAAHALAVPEAGVVREGDGTMTVWTTVDDKHFVKRVVRTGIRQDGWVQILDGINARERVVTDGAVFLSNQLLLGDTN